MNIGTLNKAIEASSKMTGLLNELKESIAYEACKYHLVFDDNISFGQNKVYHLVLIKSKSITVSGNVSRIKSYINLRNIDTDTIYNYSQIQPYLQ